MPGNKHRNDYTPAEWAAAGVAPMLAPHYVKNQVVNLCFAVLYNRLQTGTAKY